MTKKKVLIKLTSGAQHGYQPTNLRISTSAFLYNFHIYIYVCVCVCDSGQCSLAYTNKTITEVGLIIVTLYFTIEFSFNVKLAHVIVLKQL